MEVGRKGRVECSVCTEKREENKRRSNVCKCSKERKGSLPTGGGSEGGKAAVVSVCVEEGRVNRKVGGKGDNSVGNKWKAQHRWSQGRKKMELFTVVACAESSRDEQERKGKMGRGSVVWVWLREGQKWAGALWGWGGENVQRVCSCVWEGGTPKTCVFNHKLKN